MKTLLKVLYTIVVSAALIFASEMIGAYKFNVLGSQEFSSTYPLLSLTRIVLLYLGVYTLIKIKDFESLYTKLFLASIVSMAVLMIAEFNQDKETSRKAFFPMHYPASYAYMTPTLSYWMKSPLKSKNFCSNSFNSILILGAEYLRIQKFNLDYSLKAKEWCKHFDFDERTPQHACYAEFIKRLNHDEGLSSIGRMFSLSKFLQLSEEERKIPSFWDNLVYQFGKSWKHIDLFKDLLILESAPISSKNCGP
jgi:hypothetical protein